MDHRDRSSEPTAVARLERLKTPIGGRLLLAEQTVPLSDALPFSRQDFVAMIVIKFKHDPQVSFQRPRAMLHRACRLRPGGRLCAAPLLR